MINMPFTPSPLRLPLRTLLFTVLAVAALITLSFSMAATAQAQTQTLTCPIQYTVQSRDSLVKLAAADSVSVRTLQQINGIINPNLIFVGQVICLPSPLPTTTPVFSATPLVTGTLSGIGTAATTSTLANTGTVTAIPSFIPTVLAIPATFVPTAVPVTYPSIAFDRGLAYTGDTVTVTGINFPANATVQVFYKPLTSADAYAPIGQTVVSDTGTINFPLAVPAAYENNPLLDAISILVRDPVSGYYGYSFFYARAALAASATPIPLVTVVTTTPVFSATPTSSP